jgi:stearoyl-CoA 9-desaturase NADPH oxidoreductase
MPLATTARRLLRSPLIDVLVGPHGVDRYLELIRPEITVRDARAKVIEVRHQTPRSVTLTLRPNSAWTGFRAGQFVRIGVEIDGVRRTRTYSPACSEHRADGLLELTVTAHTHGLLSRHLRAHCQPGTVLHLGPAQGEFTLPEPRPERLILISGGSGITPVLSMLRTLCDEGHGGAVEFIHYARTARDWLYRSELEALAARHRNLTVECVATREGGAHLSAQAIGAADGAHAAVCGPPALIEAVRGIWPADRVLAETFTPPTAMIRAAPRGGAAGDLARAAGTLSFLHSEKTALIAAGTLLEQAEAAGLSPEFGCRMGICHTCTCRKTAGAVRNVLTGELSEEEDEDIQLCVSIPAGDIALEI